MSKRPRNTVAVPFAELGVVDLGQYRDGPEGLEVRKKLAKDLEEACRTQGFFFLSNTGYPQEKLDDLVAYSQALLDRPTEEIEQWLAGSLDPTADLTNDKVDGPERGTGYKQLGYWKMQKDTPDSIKHHNWRNLLHPALLEKERLSPFARQHLPEVVDYFSYIHLDILPKLSNLFDLILEVPEGTTWKLFDVTQNDPDNSGGGFGRAMLYEPMPAKDEARTGGTWLRGHSDGNSLTFLTSQPMASLQFRDYHDGQWKYVAYKPGALVVNIGDQYEFLTGSYFKSTIHRVVGPPNDQRGHRRLGLIYFCNTKPHVFVDPQTYNSPKLERLGYAHQPGWDRITSEQWDVAKGKTYGKAVLNGEQQENASEEPKNILLYGRYAQRWHQKV